MTMQQPCVLIAEDDAVLRSMLHDLLRKEGYRVLAARDGKQALAEMRGCRPDLIIADIVMPNMNGYDFYNAVRQCPEWISIPFIFLTAKDEHDDVMRGKALGAEEYITKPFSAEDLLIILRARLQRHADIQKVIQANTAALKEQIISVLSHELRTPLTFISGYTDLALADAHTLSDPQFRNFLYGIKYGSDRLTKLVMDLLLVFEIEAGSTAHTFEMDVERCDEIGPLIADIVAAYAHEAQRNHIQLDVNIPPHLPPAYVSKDLLANALERLIDNSLKFTNGSDARVMVTAQGNRHQVAIAVTDNGIGIAPEHVPQLFEPFQQFNRDEMEQQGLGVGLYIAQQLVKLHGGEITVVSQPGKGSRFTLHLPRAGKRGRNR